MATKKKPSRGRLVELMDQVGKQGLHGPKCWGSRLKGPAREFVDAMVAKHAAGGYVNLARAQTIILDEFGLKIVTSSVRGHITGICACKRA
ncbi:MAG: hypothetical protein ACREIS_13460 [Nitrospiraceae bacterium]